MDIIWIESWYTFIKTNMDRPIVSMTDVVQNSVIFFLFFFSFFSNLSFDKCACVAWNWTKFAREQKKENAPFLEFRHETRRARAPLIADFWLHFWKFKLDNLSLWCSKINETQNPSVYSYHIYLLCFQKRNTTCI